MIHYHHVKTFSQNDVPLYLNLYKMLVHLKQSYPGFTRWYFTKFILGLPKGQRQIIYATDDNMQIVGLALLKQTPEEDKICCLWVTKDYRCQGIASQLVCKSLKALNNPMPKVTVSEESYSEFEQLFKKYGFVLTLIQEDEYIAGKREFHFN